MEDETKRPLTQTEIRIIERDASEQRTLSGELNGRSYMVLTMLGVAAGAATTLDLIASRGVALVLVAILLFVFREEVFVGKGYGYPQVEEDWVTWMDKHTDEDEILAETEYMAQSYYRDLMQAARLNRKANQQKSKESKIAGSLSVTLIIAILFWSLVEQAFLVQ